MTRANAEMVEGFMDGSDKNAPEPSSNRSRSYRYGFRCGRLDNSKEPQKLRCSELIKMADEVWRLTTNYWSEK